MITSASLTAEISFENDNRVNISLTSLLEIFSLSASLARTFLTSDFAFSSCSVDMSTLMVFIPL